VAGSGIRPPPAGSGKLATPWARMHWENWSACPTSGVGGAPEVVTFGSKYAHAVWAVCSCESLTPSCCVPILFLSNCPLLSGSGQLGTPWPRIQAAKASGLGVAEALGVVEPDESAVLAATDVAVAGGTVATAGPGEAAHAAARTAIANIAVNLLAAARQVRAGRLTLSFMDRFIRAHG
jgi:hypothetical protein